MVFGVEVTQKVPVWLRLTAVDEPGHGSSPRPTSSLTRLVDALTIIRENPFPPRIIPEVATYFAGIAQSLDGEWGPAYANIEEAVTSPDFLAEFQDYRPGHHALTRDTCSITRLSGSNKINVVPPSAWAELDCRMLPDRPAEEFIADLTALVEGTGVEVSVIMALQSHPPVLGYSVLSKALHVNFIRTPVCCLQSAPALPTATLPVTWIL